MLTKLFGICALAILLLTSAACHWLYRDYPEVISRRYDYAAVAPADAMQNVIAALSASCLTAQIAEDTPDVTRFLSSGELYKLPVGTLVALPPTRFGELESVTVKDGPQRGRAVWICGRNIWVKHPPL